MRLWPDDADVTRSRLLRPRRLHTGPRLDWTGRKRGTILLSQGFGKPILDLVSRVFNAAPAPHVLDGETVHTPLGYCCTCIISWAQSAWLLASLGPLNTITSIRVTASASPKRIELLARLSSPPSLTLNRTRLIKRISPAKAALCSLRGGLRI